MNGSRESGASRAPQLAILLLVAGGAAWVLTQGSNEHSQTPEPPRVEDAEAGARTAADVEEREEPESPSHTGVRILPPDSPVYSRTAAPVSAIVRGEVVLTAEVEFPDTVNVRIRPQAALPGSAEAEAGYHAAVTSAARGFRFEPVPFGDWKVTLDAPGFQDQTVLLSLDASNADVHLLLSLLPANHLRGRVLQEDGGLVAGILVTATRIVEDHNRVILPHSAATDEQGEFDISGVVPGTYRIHAGPPNNALSEPRQVQLIGAEGWVELVVPPLGSAAVTVRDLASGEPLKGLTVIARSEKGHTASAESPKGGRLVFPHLPPGTYTFTAYGDKRRRRVERGVVLVDQTCEVEIRVAALD